MEKNNITELVFILDRSGSMGGLESDTIGGFNGMIEKQKKEEGKAFVTTILFDNKIETLHDRIDLQEINPLTDKDYYVRGCTALLDAIGTTVNHISGIHKYARPEDVPAHTMFVITTDGKENASREFDYQKIKSMIEEKKKLGWEFIFIGANIDSVAESAKLGISANRSINYMADHKGTTALFGSISRSVSEIRSGEALSDAWRECIDEDMKSRK